MATISEFRTLGVNIDRPADEVYAFLSQPENFPAWASGLGKSLTKTDGAWIAETPHGPMRVRFTERNAFGILDHYVMPAADAEVYVPMRAIANGTGCTVTLTLFRRPDMSDDAFAADAAWVERDLKTLRSLLEAGER